MQGNSIGLAEPASVIPRIFVRRISWPHTFLPPLAVKLVSFFPAKSQESVSCTFENKSSPVVGSFNLQEPESSSWSCKAPFDATKKHRELCRVYDVSTVIHCKYTTNKWFRLQFKYFKQICSKLWVFSGFRSRADDVSILLERVTSSHKNGELLHSSCIRLIQVPRKMKTSWKLFSYLAAPLHLEIFKNASQIPSL